MIRLGRVSILVKLVLMMACLLLVAGGIGLAIALNEANKNAKRAFILENKRLSQIAARSIEESYYQGTLPFKTLREVKQTPGVLFWWIVRPDGTIYMADDPSIQGGIVGFPVGVEPVVRDYVYRGEYIKLFAQPLNIGEPGWAFLLGVSTSSVKEALNREIIRGIAYLSIVFAFACALAALIAIKFTSPIMQLIQGTKALANGNFNTRVNIRTRDELGELGNSFNEMVEKLSIVEERKMRIKDAAIETSINAISMFDIDGRVTYANPSFLKIWGYVGEGALGKHLGELGIEGWEDVMRSVEEKGGWEGEVKVKRRDGSEFFADASFSLVKDKMGKPIQIMASFSDITKRKEAEEKLRKSEEKYSSLVESTEDSIYLLDRNLRYLFVNKHHLSQFGFTLEEITKKSYGDIHPEEETRELKEKVEEVFRTGNSVQHEHRSLRDGRYFLRTLSPVKDREGRTIAVTIVSKNITYLKYMEAELRERNKEMERFNYVVAHDLRAPLISIEGFAGMLRGDLKRGEVENAKVKLGYIERAAKKMENLLESLLELSRIGRVANPPERVPFGEIVKDALLQTAGQIEMRGVEVEVAPDFPTVYVDRTRIEQVLINLITNSVKFMGDQPHPKIEIGYYVKDGGHVFFVKDNGIGIDPSQHERVFDLFYQLDKGKGGVGAGLAIVKRIIDVHGGRVWIESEVGKGCKVCFTLPVGG